MKDLILSPLGLRAGNKLFPCVIGKNGVSKLKREGDGKRQLESIKLWACYIDLIEYQQPRKWALPIRPRDIWSDDVKDPNYNLMGTLPSSFGHERLFRSDHLYDLIIITNWNWPYAVKGRGSAIFIHSWRKKSNPQKAA